MLSAYRQLIYVSLIAAGLLSGCSKSTPTAPTGTTTSNCTFAVSSSIVSVGASGGPISVTLTTANACAWTALTNASFITVTSPIGQTGSGNLTFTVAANTGTARTGSVTAGGQTVIVEQTAAPVAAAPTPTPAPPPATADAILGNWTGTITLTAGCVPGLPRAYPWTGTIRAGGATGTELVITVTGVAISGAVFPLTLTGNSIAFSVPFDSQYSFTGTVSSDRRSIPNGTFTGANCSPLGSAVIPLGTWTAAHQ